MSLSLKMWQLPLFVLGCLFIRLAFADGFEESVISNISNSRELFQPTPLITNLSRSDAELLMQETNNMFVSNTSLLNLLQNNATHHMIQRYRERNRQIRIMEIQHEILQKLGVSRNHSVTSRMSAEERQSLVMSFDRTMFSRIDNDTVDCDDETVC